MHYTNKDQIKLYRHEWSVPTPKAKILILHGLAEHAGRYEELAKELNHANYTVISYDQRGNGRSGGLVAHIDSYSQLTDDLDMVSRKEKVERLPFILLSHSLGGLTAARYLVDCQDHPYDMAIFSAPAVLPDDDMAPLLRKVAGIVSRLFPKLPAARLPQDMISKDPEVRARYQSDPLIYRGKIRARKGYEIMKCMNYVANRFEHIDVPILIMHGSDDKITDPKGSQLLYDGVSSTDKSIQYYEGLYHEIFNEPERKQVIADTIAWMDDRV